MGWWGYGIYDGDAPQDAIYMIGVTAFGRKTFDSMLDESAASTEKVLLSNKKTIRKHRKKILDEAMKNARRSWDWDGPAEIIATAMMLKQLGIDRFHQKFYNLLEDAFNCEREAAADFDSKSARLDVLKRAKRKLGV